MSQNSSAEPSSQDSRSTRSGSMARMSSRSARLPAALAASRQRFSTEDRSPVAAVIGIHPVKTLKTNRPAAFLIVDAPVAETATVARRLARDGLEASIATTVLPSNAALRTLRATFSLPRTIDRLPLDCFWTASEDTPHM